MAGFDNDTMYADNVDFSGSATPSPQVLLDGQLLIGSTATPHIKVGTLTAGAGISITNGSGAITIAATGGITPVGGLIPDANTAPGTTPVVGDGAGNITVTGAQVAAGVVGTNVIRTDSLAANTMTIEIQRSTAAAVSTPADNGVSHFDSSIFSVGAGGFVSLAGGAIPPAQKFTVDANTAPGTNPVVATALGVITVSGKQVASGVVGTNVIRTNSIAANAYDIEIQRTTTAAVSTVADNGVSHFDSSIFTADGNGFISLAGGSVPPSQKFNVDTNNAPGTNPVLPSATGAVTITGAQVASGVVGTNVIRTDSEAANSLTVEVQRSTAVAATDLSKNGVCHFNNAQFTVDANGFVSSTVTAGATVTGQIFTTSGAFTYTPTAGTRYAIVELVGGGGGSGGIAVIASNEVSSGGGAGGGYAKFILTAADIGASLSGNVGAAGAAGASGSNDGGDGGNTTLATTAAWTAGGGKGGKGAGASTNFLTTGGVGGTNTVGTGTLLSNISGQHGFSGLAYVSSTNFMVVSGAGGDSQLGRGGHSASAFGNGTTAGNAGSAYGGGAAGACAISNTGGNSAGSAGAAGVAIFTEFR